MSTDSCCPVGRMIQGLTNKSTGPLAHPFAPHRTHIRLLRTTRFARALLCARSLARSLTLKLVGKWFLSMKGPRCLRTVLTHCGLYPMCPNNNDNSDNDNNNNNDNSDNNNNNNEPAQPTNLSIKWSIYVNILKTII